jgi:hypothetical protein
MATSKQTDDLKQQEEILKRIQELYRKVYGEDIPIANLERLKKETKEAAQYAALLEKAFNEVNDSLGSAFKSLSGIVSEISKSNVEVRETKKGFDNLYSISSKILNIDITSSDVKKKTFTNLKQSITGEQNRLTISRNLLVTEQESLNTAIASRKNKIAELEDALKLETFTSKRRKIEEQIASLKKENSDQSRKLKVTQDYIRNINGALDEEEGVIKTILEALGDTETKFDSINKKVGIFGATVEGIGKGLTKAGFGRLADALGIDDAITKTKKFVEASKGAASGFSVAGKLLKELGTNLVKSLTLTDLIVGGLTAVVVGLINRFKELDKDASEFARALGTSRDNAFDLRQQLNSVGNISGELFLTGGKIAKVFGDIASSVSLGIAPNTKIGNTLATNLAYMTKMVEQGKLSKEAADAFFRISSVTGKPVGKIAQETAVTVTKLNLQNKSSISLRSVMDAIGKTSAATRLTLAKFPDGIAGAITKAKSLGFELDDLNKIADSLLNFEESISSEFEAELLTNKDLNLERARAFALQGNSVELAKELSRQVGTAAEFGNMNVIQQNSLAKAFGLSRDELAKTLETQDALKALGADSVKAAEAKFKALEKEVGTQEALKRLGSNSLTQQFATASRQDKINALTDKFLALAEKLLIPLSKAADFLISIADSASKVISFFSGGTGEIDGMNKALDETNNKVKSFKDKLGLSDSMKSAIEKIASVGAIFLGFKALSGLFKFFTRGSSPNNPMFVSMGIPGKPGVGGAGASTAATAAKTAGKAASEKLLSKTGGSLSKAALEGAGKQVMSASGQPLYGAAAKSAIESGSAKVVSTGFFGKLGEKMASGLASTKAFASKINPLQKFGEIFKGKAGSFFGKALKYGGISSLFEAYFANSDIKDLIGQGLSPDELAKSVGKRTIGGIGGILGGVGATGLVNLLNLVGVPGFLASAAAYTAGDGLGKYLGGLLADNAEGLSGSIGKSVLNTFYKKELEQANYPGFKDGGVIPATPGGKTIRVAEGGKAEIVSPVEKLIDPLAAAIAALSTKLDEVVNATKASGQMVAMAVQDNSGMTLDGDVITRKVMSRMNTQYSGIK